MTGLTIKIEGMSCMHCVGRVEKALTELEGVEKADISLEENKATIEYDESKIDPDKFKQAVEESGYKVVG
jgi:copper chaperone